MNLQKNETSRYLDKEPTTITTGKPSHDCSVFFLRFTTSDVAVALSILYGCPTLIDLLHLWNSRVSNNQLTCFL